MKVRVRWWAEPERSRRRIIVDTMAAWYEIIVWQAAVIRAQNEAWIRLTAPLPPGEPTSISLPLTREES